MIATAVFISLFLTSLSKSGKLPPSFRKCTKQSKDFDKCLKTAVEIAVRLMKKPIRELGTPSLEPLTFANAVFPNRHSTSMALQEKFNCHSFYGISEAKVSLFNINFDNTLIQTVFEFKSLKQKANFTVSGNVLSEPVHYSGYLEVEFINNTFTIDAIFEEVEKKGLTYANIINSNLKWTPKNIKVVKSLGAKRETNHFLKLIKDHWSTMFGDVKPDYERLFDESFKKYANLVFSKVSMSELFGVAEEL